MAEWDDPKRNLDIHLTLHHTGLRVGELCALRLSDIAIFERKGMLAVRSGKRSNTVSSRSTWTPAGP